MKRWKGGEDEEEEEAPTTAAAAVGGEWVPLRPPLFFSSHARACVRTRSDPLAFSLSFYFRGVGGDCALFLIRSVRGTVPSSPPSPFL